MRLVPSAAHRYTPNISFVVPPWPPTITLPVPVVTDVPDPAPRKTLREPVVSAVPPAWPTTTFCVAGRGNGRRSPATH